MSNKKYVFLDNSSIVRAVVTTSDPNWTNKDETLKAFTQMKVDTGVTVGCFYTWDGTSFSAPVEE